MGSTMKTRSHSKRTAMAAAIVVALVLAIVAAFMLHGAGAAGAQGETAGTGESQTFIAMPESIVQQNAADFPLGADVVAYDGEGDPIALSQVDPESYEGFIFTLDDDTDAAVLDAKTAEALQAQVIEHLYGNVYKAVSLEGLDRFFDEGEVCRIEPDYTVYLTDEDFDFDANAFCATLESAVIVQENSATPDDPYYVGTYSSDGTTYYKQDELTCINAAGAWESGVFGQSFYSNQDTVVIADIDSGLAGTGADESLHVDIDYTHVLEGVNYVTSDEGTPDTLGHGTFTAAQMFAATNNGEGIASIAPETYIVPLKVFEGRSASSSDVVLAIKEAADSEYGVDVINMSLGSTSYSSYEKEACEAAVAAGIIVCASAGNDASDKNNYPAAYDCVVGVSALTTDGIFDSSYSNYGADNVFVSAPGTDIISLYYGADANGERTRYTMGSGTSFSAPMASALGALSKSIDPDLTQEEFMQLLIDTSTDAGDAGYDVYYGYGIINCGQLADSLLAQMNLSEYEVTFAVTDVEGIAVSDPVILLVAAEDIVWEETDEAGQVTTNTISAGTVIEPDDDGIYLLHRGRYTYTVSHDGYKSVRATFETTAAHMTISVQLTAVYDWDITVVDSVDAGIAGASVTASATDGVETQATTDAEGVAAFKLGTDTYTLVATADGYLQGSASVSVADAAGSAQVRLYKQEELATVTVSFADTDFGFEVADVQLTLVNRDGQSVEANDDGAYTLAKGETYYYTTSKDGYETESGTFTLGTDDEQTVVLKVTSKRFAVTLSTYDFAGNYLDAVVTVTRDNGQDYSDTPRYQTIPAEADGGYQLPNGSYSYDATCEGYSSATGTFTVASSDMAFSTYLTGEPQAVHVSASDATTGEVLYGVYVSLENANNDAMPLSEGNVFAVEKGSYTYTAYLAGYRPAMGTVEVTQDSELSLELMPGDVTLADYAGGSGTQDDPYLVACEAQLRRAGATTTITRTGQQSSTSNQTGTVDTCFKLLCDIKLDEDEAWTPLGQHESSGNYLHYAGSFDGAGFTVSGVHVSNTARDYLGFFGYLEGATVRNLTVAGSITGREYVGGIAGCIDAAAGESPTTVLNCENQATVTGSIDVGGIVGSVTGPATGESSAIVSACVNSGSVAAKRVRSGMDFFNNKNYDAGGIAGQVSCALISSCINLGAVDSGYAVGGIAGVVWNNATLASTLGLCAAEQHYDSYDITYGGSSGAIAGRNYGSIELAGYTAEAGTVGVGTTAVTAYSNRVAQATEAELSLASYLHDANIVGTISREVLVAVSESAPDEFWRVGVTPQLVAEPIDIATCDVADIPSVESTGVVVPEVSVSLGGVSLAEGIDFTVTVYTDEACTEAADAVTEAGTYYVKISGIGSYSGSVVKTFEVTPKTMQVYRLYNKWSGEHLFTVDASEVENLTPLGWIDESSDGWTAPESGNVPIYRLYNQYSGDHLYTYDKDEYDSLCEAGWTGEDVSFYSAEGIDGSFAIYRLFNKYVKVGTHHFATTEAEYDDCVEAGWTGEGVYFYGLPLGE